MRRLRASLAVALVVFAGPALGGCAVLDELLADDTVDTGEAPAGARTEDDDDFGTVEIYDVLTDGSLDPEPDGLRAEVWQTFERIATREFAAETMLEFRVGDAPDSDTLAYVYQADDPRYWVLADNLATSGDRGELIATLVHEYAHVLTLSRDQTVPVDGACPTVETSEGCAFDDAVLWTFEQRFWAGYADAPDVDNQDGDVAWAFYQEHEDDFVSDYAATNVVEDLAESFMTYVLEEPATGDTVVADKLRFFDEYPAFAAHRERIRAEFAGELGLG